MKYIIILLSFMLALPCYAHTVAETEAKIRTVKRYTTKNKNQSMHDLTKKTIKSRNEYGQNYSFCDFDDAVLDGKFERCNFSFSINLDTADTTKAEFIECNFSFADLPKGDIKDCNTIRLDKVSQSSLDEIYNEVNTLQTAVIQ